MKIILASKSPRRKELLKKIVNDFIIIPSDIDESKYPLDEIAYHKALKIAKMYPSDLIISADTIVKINDEVLGKPKDKVDAKRMLLLLSDKTHEVITYYCIYNFNKEICIRNAIHSYVTFNNLEDELIDKYISSLSPFDKAGAYGIQDKEYHLVRKLEGDEDNVIGMPISAIKKDLIELGIITK